MKTPPSAAAAPAGPAGDHPIWLAGLTPKQLACLLVAPPANIAVDCGGLLLPHPLGVCHFLTQLMTMQRRGTDVQLCNVHPVLGRSLRQLGLATVFHLES